MCGALPQLSLHVYGLEGGGHALAQLVEALHCKPGGRGFDWHNPSVRAMALGSTQPLTEMSTRNISKGVKAAGTSGWQPYHLNVPIVLKSGILTLLDPSGPVQACNGVALRLLPGALLGIGTTILDCSNVIMVGTPCVRSGPWQWWDILFSFVPVTCCTSCQFLFAPFTTVSWLTTTFSSQSHNHFSSIRTFEIINGSASSIQPAPSHSKLLNLCRRYLLNYLLTYVSKTQKFNLVSC